MVSKITFKYDRRQLLNIDAFMKSNYQVRIGVLSNEWKSNPGGKYERKIGPVELAMVHEFGSPVRNIPSRSFFRKTMFTRRDDFQAEITGNKDKIAKTIAEGNGLSILQKVGAKWRSFVFECFEVGGPGWLPLKPRTLAMRRHVLNPATGKREPSHKILWVTGALARSITWDIWKGK